MNNRIFKCIILLTFFTFFFSMNINIGMKLIAYFCDPCIFIPAFFISRKISDDKKFWSSVICLGFVISTALEFLLEEISYTYSFQIENIFYRFSIFVLWVFLAKKNIKVLDTKKDLKSNNKEKNNKTNLRRNKHKILYPIIILLIIFTGCAKLIWNYNNLYSYNGLKYITLTELKILKLLGIDFNKRDYVLGDTLLMRACNLDKNFEIIKFLLDMGININSKDSNGDTALTYAASDSNNPELVKFLIKQGALTNDSQVESACMFTKNPAIIQVLLDNGAKKCSLPWAAWNKNIDVVKFILNKGVKIDELNDALIQASAHNDNLDVVRLLIKRGADVNSKNKNGDTALIVASEKGNKELIKILLDAGADINEKDKNGYSIIFNIVNKFDKKLFELALQENINFDAKINPEEDTLLLYLVKYLRSRAFNNYIGLYVGSKIDDKQIKKQAVYFINMILKKKFNYSAKDHKGMTTLDYLDEMSKLHDNDLYEEKRNIYWQLKDLVCFDEQGKERECNIQTQKQNNPIKIENKKPKKKNKETKKDTTSCDKFANCKTTLQKKKYCKCQEYNLAKNNKNVILAPQPLKCQVFCRTHTN